MGRRQQRAGTRPARGGRV
ncbi:Ornithine carbamoyltransferase [Caballeronia sordidicola]|uniref:Ornithine carbamoyltransferase n=1 Tax=Caballeronia sordidicola TaxID=196367 RepID=A0A242MHZ5_CABSO|nr:Ornithine carbamoyltransferase [Caballeronia sordidicola]